MLHVYMYTQSRGEEIIFILVLLVFLVWETYSKPE